METPKIIRSSEGHNIMSGRQIIKIRSEDSDHKMSVLLSVVPEGSGIPDHVHALEDEMFQIVEGHLELTLDGRQHILEKGDMVFLPRHVSHGFRAVEDTKMWVTFVPGGAEKMFEEFARLPSGPPDSKKIATIAEEYSIRFICEKKDR